MGKLSVSGYKLPVTGFKLFATGFPSPGRGIRKEKGRSLWSYTVNYTVLLKQTAVN